MDIHQISVSYLDEADRLLMRVRTRDDTLFEVWITRRMIIRLWPRLREAAAALAVHSALPHRPIVTPDARRMLADEARQRNLSGADFATPFAAAQVQQRPLGREPLLPSEVRMQSEPARLVMTVRERSGRHVTMQLNETLVLALQSLFEQALKAADWALADAPAAPADSLAGSRVLN